MASSMFITPCMVHETQSGNHCHSTVDSTQVMTGLGRVKLQSWLGFKLFVLDDSKGEALVGNSWAYHSTGLGCVLRQLE